MCKCDWAKCRRDCECRCHVAIEAHSTHSYKVGQFSGLEQAAGFLFGKAQEAFKHSQDELAKTLRAYSQELNSRAKEIHPGPQPNYETIEEA